MIALKVAESTATKSVVNLSQNAKSCGIIDQTCIHTLKQFCYFQYNKIKWIFWEIPYFIYMYKKK